MDVEVFVNLQAVLVHLEFLHFRLVVIFVLHRLTFLDLHLAQFLSHLEFDNSTPTCSQPDGAHNAHPHATDLRNNANTHMHSPTGTMHTHMQSPTGTKHTHMHTPTGTMPTHMQSPTGTKHTHMQSPTGTMQLPTGINKHMFRQITVSYEACHSRSKESVTRVCKREMLSNPFTVTLRSLTNTKDSNSPDLLDLKIN